MFIIKNDGLERKYEKVEFKCFLLDIGVGNLKFVGIDEFINLVWKNCSICMKWDDLLDLSANIAASMIVDYYDYGILASKLLMFKLHKNTKNIFSHVVFDLKKSEKVLIDDEFYKCVLKYEKKLNDAINYNMDYEYTYFAIKTMEKSYLLKINGKVVERPQHMLMRVSIGIHGDNLPKILETYNLLSMKYFTHASPTLFSAGLENAQMSSCFLLSIVKDGVMNVLDVVQKCGKISSHAGGIGFSIHNIKAKTKDNIKGVLPMLRVFNATARYVDQNGKRPAAITIYLEPWHADIFEFLNLRKNTGLEEERCRDLFPALWICNLFMKRVKENAMWSLMCPSECPGLNDVYGEEFEFLYLKYESEKKFVKQIKANELWLSIVKAQIETGTPFMLYKDSCNSKSNQKNIGTIQNSNLCTEIIQYNNDKEIAVCNLASISVKEFVKKDGKFDFEQFKYVVNVVTRNLNKIIDSNYYPLEECAVSNLKHRPIGIGIQGLADAFILMCLPYDSEEAKLLNVQIFETLYYGALEASCELAKEYNCTYSSYINSPISKGLLQFDLWNREPTNLWNWNDLRLKIKKYGIYNSLLIAPMPTASTAQIMGNNESFEPYTSNLYNRRVLCGEFQIVNQYLMRDLIDLNLWDEEMKNEIKANYGSIQNILRIPKHIRNLYKTVWEIPLKTQIGMAADRGAFIDQSQSFNFHIAEPTINKLTAAHFYAWNQGLKTGMYYLRTRPAIDPVQYTVDTQMLNKKLQEKCTINNNTTNNTKIDDDEICLMCSS